MIGFPYGLALIVLLACGSGVFGYIKGSHSQDSQVASLKAAIQTSENLARAADERAAKAAATIQIEYRDRVRTIEKEVPGQTQIIEVIREKSSDCVVPPEFRLLHDSAATGSKAPESPAGVDVPAPTLAEIAATVAANYQASRKNAEQLIALQNLIKGQE